MGNITLKLDDELLQNVRKLAFERNTSVNAVVAEKLKEFVAANQKKREILSGLESFYERTNAVVGKVVWNRDELHER
ncbi:MAG: CopG family transcriptional regulator [Candidatus Anammoxibacter sp.]